MRAVPLPNFDTPEDWGEVLLRDRLIQVLGDLLSSGTIEVVDQLRAHLQDEIGGAGLIQQYVLANPSALGKIPNEDDRRWIANRLFRNAKALVASCGLAMAWKNLPMSTTPKESIVDFNARLENTQCLIDDKNEHNKMFTRPSFTGEIRDLRISKLGEKLEPLPAAALFWMTWWLKTLAELSGFRSVTVPIVGVIETTNEGYGYDLELTSVSGVGDGIFDHPDCALFPVAKTWLEGLAEARRQVLERVKQEAKADGRALPADHPVCWKVFARRVTRNGNFVRLDEIHPHVGQSHGGAVARALSHLFKKMHPDYGVVVMAGLETGKRLELTQVDKISTKVEAAIRIPGVDTIVVAGEDNEREANQALPAGSRVRVLRTDGA